MSLLDLNKLLSNRDSCLAGFINKIDAIILNLLKKLSDPNTEISNQSLISFNHLSMWLSDTQLLSLLNALKIQNDKFNKKNNLLIFNSNSNKQSNNISCNVYTISIKNILKNLFTNDQIYLDNIQLQRKSNALELQQALNTKKIELPPFLIEKFFFPVLLNGLNDNPPTLQIPVYDQDLIGYDLPALDFPVLSLDNIEILIEFINTFASNLSLTQIRTLLQFLLNLIINNKQNLLFNKSILAISILSKFSNQETLKFLFDSILELSDNDISIDGLSNSEDSDNEGDSNEYDIDTIKLLLISNILNSISNDSSTVIRSTNLDLNLNDNYNLFNLIFNNLILKNLFLSNLKTSGARLQKTDYDDDDDDDDNKDDDDDHNEDGDEDLDFSIIDNKREISLICLQNLIKSVINIISINNSPDFKSSSHQNNQFQQNQRSAFASSSYLSAKKESDLEKIPKDYNEKFIKDNLSTFITISDSFLNYDPFCMEDVHHFDQDDEDYEIIEIPNSENEQQDDEDEFDFSDDDEYCDDDENNDLSPALRLRAINLIDILLTNNAESIDKFVPLNLTDVVIEKLSKNYIKGLVLRLKFENDESVSSVLLKMLTDYLIIIRNYPLYFSRLFLDSLPNNFRSCFVKSIIVYLNRKAKSLTILPFVFKLFREINICNRSAIELERNPTQSLKLYTGYDVNSTLDAILNLKDRLNLSFSNSNLIKFYSSFLFYSELLYKLSENNLVRILKDLLSGLNDKSKINFENAITCLTILFNLDQLRERKCYFKHDERVYLILNQIIDINIQKSLSMKSPTNIREMCLILLKNCFINYNENNKYSTRILDCFLANLNYDQNGRVSIDLMNEIFLSGRFPTCSNWIYELVNEMVLLLIALIRPNSIFEYKSNVWKLINTLIDLKMIDQLETKNMDQLIDIILHSPPTDINEFSFSIECFMRIASKKKYRVLNDSDLEDVLKLVVHCLKVLDSKKRDTIIKFSKSLGELMGERFKFDFFTLILNKSGFNFENQLVCEFFGAFAVAGNLSREIEKFRNQFLANKNLKIEQVVFLLQFLGFVGKFDNFNISVDEFYIHLSSSNEKIRNAASNGISHLVLKNIDYNLPFLLKRIIENKREEKKYLVMALKQNLDNPLFHETRRRDQIWNALIECEATEKTLNSSRSTLVAECLATLCENDHENINKLRVILLAENIQNQCSLLYTVIATWKFLILKTLSYEADQTMKQVLPNIIESLQNKDLLIKEIILSAVLTGLHNRPDLIMGELVLLIPKIFEELTPKREYFKFIRIGTYKKKVDDSANTRKTSYEILYTLVTSEKLVKEYSHVLIGFLFPIFEYGILKGLTDEDEIILISSVLIYKTLELSIETDNEMGVSVNNIGSNYHSIQSQKSEYENALKKFIELSTSLFTKVINKPSQQEKEARVASRKAVLVCGGNIDSAIKRDPKQTFSEIEAFWNISWEKLSTLNVNNFPTEK